MDSDAQSKIRRFTTEYVVPEDRMRLLVETEDDAVRILWLTRRLMVRMVPELVKYLSEVAPAIDKQTKGQSGSATAPGLSDNAQRQQQLNALGQMEQQPPVTPQAQDTPTQNCLISSLQVRMGRGGVVVSFLVDETEVQKLPFPQEALRQWMGILHLNFRKAQWTDDVWPAWITAKGWDQGPDSLRLN